MIELKEPSLDRRRRGLGRLGNEVGTMVRYPLIQVERVQGSLPRVHAAEQQLVHDIGREGDQSY